MRRTRKPAAAGVVSVAAGIPAVGEGIAIVVVGGGTTGLQLSALADYLMGTDLPSALSDATIPSPLLPGSRGAVLIPFGILSMIGGVGAIRRRHWKISLAGCICAAAVIPVLDLPAIVLAALSRREFSRQPVAGNDVHNAGRPTDQDV